MGMRRQNMKKRILMALALVLSGTAVYAHGPGEGPGGMMGPGIMGWGYGMGWFWPILMLVFWITVIVGIVFLIRWVSTRTREHGGFGESAIEILKSGYARGKSRRRNLRR
jgi:putative membrane protein